MTVINERWAEMAEEQRVAFATEHAEDLARPALRPPVAEPLQQTLPWPHCGDLHYPVSLDAMSHLPRNVGEMARKWKNTVGCNPIPATERVETMPSATCVDLWGRGYCEAKLDGELKGRLKAIFEKLKLWAAMNKPKTTKFDEMWDALPLFYAGPGPERADAAAGAADDMRGHLLLLIDAEYRPVKEYFYTGLVVCPKPGDTVEFTNLSPEHLKSELDLARTDKSYELSTTPPVLPRREACIDI